MKNYLIILSIATFIFSCKKKDIESPTNGLNSTQNSITAIKYNNSGNIGISVLFDKKMSAECKYSITDKGVTHTDSIFCPENSNGAVFNSNFPISDSLIVTNFFVTATSVDYSNIFIKYN